MGDVPSGFEALSLDSAFGRFVVFEQIEGDSIEDGEVLCGVASAFAVRVFAEADVEHPVQVVFDAPVLADHGVQPRRIGAEAGDVVANLALGFACGLVVPFRLDAHQRL